MLSQLFHSAPADELYYIRAVCGATLLLMTIIIYTFRFICKNWLHHVQPSSLNPEPRGLIMCLYKSWFVYKIMNGCSTDNNNVSVFIAPLQAQNKSYHYRTKLFSGRGPPDKKYPPLSSLQTSFKALYHVPLGTQSTLWDRKLPVLQAIKWVSLAHEKSQLCYILPF
jgi:hypothetical protein